MAELLLGALLPVLFERLVAPALLNLAHREKVGDLVKKWNTKLRSISKLLDDAEDKAMRGDETVQLWLDGLRDLIYDIEDVVDEFVTAEGIRSLSTEDVDAAATTTTTGGGRNSITRKVRSLFPSCCADLSPKNVMLNHELRSKMEKIGGRLDSILEEKKDLELIESSGSTRKTSYSNSNRMTDSLPKSYVIGREKDESIILADLLTKKIDDQHPFVIPIVGLGGVGKTTLAQSVFNNLDVIDAFPKRGWACVSDKFNMIDIARALLGSLGGSVGTTDDLNVLHNKLREILAKEKFLIVLDDYWNGDYNDWERLFNLYSLGLKGSKVIVTTRNQDIASMMTNNRPTFRLRELSRDDCLSLLAYHALGIDNFDAHSHLKLIGEEISAKCKGLPLAAKTLGGLLRSKSDTREWEDIRDSKIWNLPQGKDGILIALKLSYIHLPPHLKRCFVFCAIFPQDYEFDRDELVLLWMAEGLVDMKSADSMRGMVYQGKKQFDELLNRSFFQRSTQNESLFVMHDLMHDLSTSIGGNVCLNVNKANVIEVVKCKFSENVRHLSFSSISGEMDAKFEKLHALKGLRTFLSNRLQLWCHLSDKALEELLQNLKYLRALCLSGYRIEKLPNCIGHLKHLRYLNFSTSFGLKKLPESICTLYNLETLILTGCLGLTELPLGMEKLINLKCLDIRDTPGVKKLPVELGHMHNLEILSKFIVGREDGLRLKVLRNLQHLQRDFSILDLQNVEDVGDARDAWLSGKVGLTTLVLKWGFCGYDSKDTDKEKQVLELLQPHRRIKEVEIDGYGGISFPLWIGDPSMTHMTKVRLGFCGKVTILPSFGILPCLRELDIERMDAVHTVGSEFYGNVETPFPSLEVLKFKKMQTWEVWSSFSSSCGDREIEEVFPRLIKLELEYCLVLVSNLPHRLCSVVELKINECPLLKASPCMTDLSSLKDLDLQGCDHDHLAMMISSMSPNAPIKRISLHSIQKLTYLNQDTLSSAEILKIGNCDELIGLWEDNVISEAVVGSLANNSLKYLSIRGCVNLRKLPNNMQKLTSLKELKIKDCSKLESLPEEIISCNIKKLCISRCGISLEVAKLPSSLISLEVRACASLHRFPSTYIHLTNLKIEDCPYLEVFPKLPSCLRSLLLQNCKKIKALPYQMNTTLTSLQHLVVIGLSIESFPEGGLPLSIEILVVGKCPRLKQPLEEWGLHRLTALKSLHLWGEIGILCQHQQEGIITMTSSFPPLPSDWLLFPPNLEVLEIMCKDDMVRLSNGLRHHLTSLHQLTLLACSKLQFLPDEGFPPSLEYLNLVGCSQDIESKFLKNGEYFPLIASIPEFIFNPL